MSEKTESLRKIKEEVISLQSSPLYEERKKNKVFPVIGEGDHDAEIMFVGEAPGAREAATGRPFCGSAGTILTEMIESADLKREDVYITNILKDRPPNNRDPLPEEIEMYAPFLDRQIEIIQPKVIAPLGRFAAKYILEKYEIRLEPFSISKIHGIIYNTKDGNLLIIPLQHPAVAVYNPSRKEELKKGFESLRRSSFKKEKEVIESESKKEQSNQ